MRKSLFTAAALAPLLFCAFGAQAATTVNTTVTETQETSTAANGQPDDLVLGSGGVVDLTSGVGVLVDSNNDFTNSGAIDIDGGDGSTGILVETPYTGDITGGGRITIGDGYDAEDTNEDGILDGPFAQGSGRYGIRIMGPGTYTGSLNYSGAITVDGNDSYGISIESLFDGDIDLGGTTTLTGDNTTAFRQTAGVDGKVTITGSLFATGEGAVGVDMGGDITGSLRIYNAIQATGYRVTQRITDPEALEKLLDENLLQSGSALVIRGDVLGGIFLGSPPNDSDGDEDDDDDATEDRDMDGVPDNAEGTASVRVFGSAPAIRIGEAGEDIQIGKFGTAENGYGLIIRGAVQAQGIFDGFSATGIRIGGDAGGTVNIDGGIRITGGVSATAYKADASGLMLLDGTTVNELRNEGSLLAAMFSDTATTAKAVFVDDGAVLNSLVNSGTISGSGTGELVSGYAVQDLSGTLSSVTNSGTIRGVTNTAPGVTNQGVAVALDLRANTSGVTLVQNANPNSTETAPIVPTITGDILLGAGDDTVDLNDGLVNGALDFGAGTGVLSINGGAAFTGELRAGGSLAISVNDGKLDNRSTTTVQASSVSVGADGQLFFALDPNAGQATLMNVSGAATVADGGQLGVSILSLPTANQRFTVLQAQTLDIQGDAGSLLGDTPYLVVAGLDIDEADGRINVDVRRRTAEEAGFNASQTAAYDAVYEDLSRDREILGVFLAQSDRDGLIGLYDQMLPDHAGGVLRALSWAQEGANRAAADWPRGVEEASGPTRAWTQEIAMGEQKERGDSASWNIYGFGAAGGLESVSATGSAIGVQTNFTIANITNPDTAGDDIVGVAHVGAGVYWRGVYGDLHVDAQAGVGYMWAHSERQFIAINAGQVINRETEADWTGFTVNSRAGLAYEWRSGRMVVVPSVHLDYFRLMESGYEESGGGAGFDVEVDERTSDLLTLTSSISVGYTFGERVRYGPELMLGWRHVLVNSGGLTRGRFVGGTTPFELLGEPMEGGAPIVRVGFRVWSGWLDLLADVGGEFQDTYTDFDLRLTARVIF